MFLFKNEESLQEAYLAAKIKAKLHNNASKGESSSQLQISRLKDKLEKIETRLQYARETGNASQFKAMQRSIKTTKAAIALHKANLSRSKVQKEIFKKKDDDTIKKTSPDSNDDE